MAQGDLTSSHLLQDKDLMARIWAWEPSIKHQILAAGSLRSDDGLTAVGSLMVLDVATREESLTIWATDPAIQASPLSSGIGTPLFLIATNSADVDPA